MVIVHLVLVTKMSRVARLIRYFPTLFGILRITAHACKKWQDNDFSGKSKTKVSLTLTCSRVTLISCLSVSQ
jgi:hypothetical protein